MVEGSEGHFWIQLPEKHQICQKYPSRKKRFLQTCVPELYTVRNN